MASKIFISYRRQDSAANALGIGQYLEHVFGRKNVFIDVDMRAGAKFPKVLEERLAECKVMLVLIGPEWLNARDEQGHRRLDIPDDWVRLEIAHALRRNITVIPVRVNGGELPAKSTLPDDIQGLLDHQAASVTIAGFRNEMSGLVRDLRSIPSPRQWARFGAIAAGLLASLIAFGLYWTPGLLDIFARIRPPVSSQVPESEKQNGVWSSSPGEWVLYEVGGKRFAHYFKPSSVMIFGDKAAFTGRFPLEPVKATGTEKTFAVSSYEDDTTVFNCKSSISALAEKTTYNESGEVTFHYKWSDPESLDLSIGAPVAPGTVLSSAERVACDQQLHVPILSKEQVANNKFSYLGTTGNGDGDIFYGPISETSDSDFKTGLLVIIRLHQDHEFTQIFSGMDVIGLPPSYRSFAERLEINCANRKLRAPRLDYFDSASNFIYLSAPLNVQTFDVQQNTPFGLMFSVACDSQASIEQVRGTYEGMNSATYENGGKGEQKISIVVEQTGSDVNVNFETANGSIGKGSGRLVGSTIETFSLRSTAAGCSGSYEASIKFSGDSAIWSYKGQDCGGPMQGHGTAKRTKL